MREMKNKVSGTVSEKVSGTVSEINSEILRRFTPQDDIVYQRSFVANAPQDDSLAVNLRCRFEI